MAVDRREIRIFVSSTFLDMGAERELLVKRVFPDLRSVCAERFVTFTEVDLRWGITEEQASEGQVLPICLEEIEQSRPYFIGLLGERYGWIPESVPEETMEREPWLREHVVDGKSVTELEILHGVLRNPSMDGHAYFYFRDPAYLDRLPESEDRTEYESEDEAAARRLRDLKEEIRRTRDGGTCRLLEDYADPEALAAAVQADLTELIDRLYPKEETPDPLDQEAEGHAAYARQKLFAYVDRPAHETALDAAVEAEGPPLVVTGESGGGKTALLAAWVSRWREAHPDDFVFEHYLGATPGSASATGLMQRLLGELKRRYEIDEELPAQPDELRDALPLWLARTVGRGRIVLVLDALNQVEGDEPDRRLVFLPRYFPPHVRVIGSALPGPGLEALRERGWSEHELPLPDADERERMVTEFLGAYRKELGSPLRREVVEAPGARNPLFLRTVLEELRQFGSFEALPDRVRHYLEAESPEALFRRVIRRWQEDFDQDRDLVCRALRFLWAAREGLAEAEWLALLGSGDEPLARRVWRPLFLAMESHLARRGGLYAFGHDFLRRAVEAEFLGEPEEQRAAHRELADHFGARSGMDPRKAAEWPWQLAEAEEWFRLQIALTNVELLLARSENQTAWELTGYWLRLRPKLDRHNFGAGTMALKLNRKYRVAYMMWQRDNAGPYDSIARRIASFFILNGHYWEARWFCNEALEECTQRVGSTHPETLSILQTLATIEREIGPLERAEALQYRVLEGRRRTLGPDHPETLFSTLALATVLSDRGDQAQAERVVVETLETARRSFGPLHPVTMGAANDLAVLLMNRKAYSEAEDLLRGSLKEQEPALGPEHPQTLATIANLGACLLGARAYPEAELLIRQVLEADERLLGPEHPDTSVCASNLAAVLRRQGKFREAAQCYGKALPFLRLRLGPTHPTTLRTRMLWADMEQFGGRPWKAQWEYFRVWQARRAALGDKHPDTRRSLSRFWFTKFRLRKYREGFWFFREWLGTSRGLVPRGVARLLRHRTNSVAREGDSSGRPPAP